MHDNYEGKHRPQRGSMDTAIVEVIGEVRDTRTRINGYDYQPRNSAYFPREVAR